MSTPKATPTTPQWAYNAYDEMQNALPNFCPGREKRDEAARIIAKHAPPPAAQPSDAAGLREVIATILCSYEQPEAGFIVRADLLLKDILTALAPYLKGEPGDSELLEWLDKAEKLWEGSNWLKGPVILNRNSIRAAMRGEGDKP